MKAINQLVQLYFHWRTFRVIDYTSDIPTRGRAITRVDSNDSVEFGVASGSGVRVAGKFVNFPCERGASCSNVVVS